jgi:hypothetical protein
VKDYRGSGVEPKNCWEYLECPSEERDNCPAFLTYHGRECYNFAEDYCTKLKKDFKRCWQCPWFKIIRPDLRLEEEDKED